MGSKRFNWNKEDGIKLAKSFGLSMLGGALLAGLDALTQIDFGPIYNPFIAALSPFLVNAVRKFVVEK